MDSTLSADTRIIRARSLTKYKNPRTPNSRIRKRITVEGFCALKTAKKTSVSAHWRKCSSSGLSTLNSLVLSTNASYAS